MSRNRVISPTTALLISEDISTSPQVIDQLYRVQKVDYTTTVNRKPVEQFGNQAPIDNVIIDPMAVSLEFSYLVTNVINESNLGFVVDGSTQAISGYLNATTDQKNYYVLTVPEGTEANLSSGSNPALNEVVGIGNGYMTNYSFEAAVGAFPVVNISVEAQGFAGYSTSSGASPLPSVDPSGGQPLAGTFSLPAPASGVAGSVSALRPKDVVLSLFAPSYGVDLNDAKIQNVKVDMNLRREPQIKLGNAFPFARELVFPIDVRVTADANVGDLTTGNLSEVLCNDQKYDLTIGINNPACTTGTPELQIQYSVKGALLVSQKTSEGLNTNKTVSIEWLAQIGGPNDQLNGLFISGSLV